MKKVSRQRVNVRTHKAHKYGHKKTRPVVSMAPKAGETPRHARLGERTKGQSALATTVASADCPLVRSPNRACLGVSPAFGAMLTTGLVFLCPYLWALCVLTLTLCLDTFFITS